MSSPHNLINAINTLTSHHEIPTCGYIDSEEFLQQHHQFLDQEQKSNFSFFHLNIRSLNSNKDKLVLLLSTLNDPFDVIALSEIWSFNIDFYANLFPNHNFFFSLCETSKIGGIGFYVHKSYSVTILTPPVYNLSPLNCETLTLEVTRDNIATVISGFYRHPVPSLTNFTQFFEFLMLDFYKKFTGVDCLVFGDININL